MESRKIIWERCCTCSEEVAAAALGRASRVELCEALELDGVTPSRSNIEKSLLQGIAVNVMVRPRGGDFLYSETEIRKMLDTIAMCGDLGVCDIVSGVLDGQGGVDERATVRLVRRAADFGLGFTFHRAFDLCTDKASALESLIAAGCTRVLTSGGAASAMEGASVIESLVKQAEGRIIVMPGGGVTPANVERLRALTGASEFHGTKLY